MKKPVLIFIGFVILISLIWFIIPKKSTPPVVDNTPVDLPINTIPLTDRPFITLSPDTSGRSLDIAISGAPKEGNMEYEMIYNASGKQEGALGSIFLGSEKQPIVKSILLGSKSGGGKVTYHEGVTGGSITVTYGETRLKESWNYLHFDPSDPIISSTDARFSVTLPKTALKKDAVIITMKTFGYPKAGLPAEPAKLVAGPYGYFTQTPIKGSAQVSLKLPAGEHINPTIYEWNGTVWKKLVTKLAEDTVSAPATSNIFVVTVE
ncbi:hypothetical protein COT87_01055 [Candidatus Collierbacteria bacterium CG10_big_fil_rev_8_21_14_0_10_44_9]|uniref:Uncharacterized protein n=1 Tax=Candidatus Collierbacteria bacterium CG10_big_fil_rev_8_21_14_0_10_44_9 TaxID=1974535 RepID=A0A2H0VLA3_9BACT|nr:MAG: hypothetical protein COT87_01055 [Candidatus Collierbacteria bacterium CG10_big_fil_rev_8_21_14_0_10_44_9]